MNPSAHTHAAPATVAASTLHGRLTRVRALAFVVGAAGTVLSIALGLMMPERFMPSYLVGFLFWFGVAFGCIALGLLQNLFFSGWGIAVRRPLEAGAMTIFPMALLFIPILLGMRGLYPWVNPTPELEHLIAFKRGFLNPSAFALRASGYFVLLAALTFVLSRWSSLQDKSADRRPTRWLHIVAGPGLLATFYTGTFASFDWIMSREPTWPSTIFGAVVIIGWGLTTLCMLIITITLLKRETAIRDIASTGRIQDLGNLTLTFVMFWAYLSFSQYLIIWSGNLSEEIPWYIRRGKGGWQFVAAGLMLFHFAVPFLILLFRDSKRRAERLATLAVFIAVMHLLEITWMVVPATADLSQGIEGVRIPWLTVLMVPVAAIGVGGLWLGSYLWFLKDKPLVPRNIPDVFPVPEHALEGAH